MLNLKEERQYRRLRKLGQELHLPIPEAFWTMEVFDKNGKLLQRHHQRSHSWVENGYNGLFALLAGVSNLLADNLEQYTTAGVQKTSNYISSIAGQVNQSGQGYRGPSGNTNHGIVVGSGVGAEVFDSSNALGYALQTLIAEGAGAGQLNYAAEEMWTVSFVALLKKATHIRYMNNNSGGNVSVNEVAIYGEFTLANGVGQYMMVCREKLGATVTVPDTGQLKVTYTIELTYPA